MKKGQRKKLSKKVSENDFLSISFLKGKTNPKDVIIRIQLKRRKGDRWSTVSEVDLYKTNDGQYTELKPKSQKLNNRHNLKA